MPGPMSFPARDRAEWAALQEIVCHNHFTCDGRLFDKHGDEVKHEYITYREWLARRGRLVTGKTS